MKSWDSAWENIFRSQEWGKYPPEELVRFVARNFYKVPDRSQIKFLDLGCGTGACSWYLAREGFSVHGIDGSSTAIEKANKRFEEENLKGYFKVMDFIKIDFPDNYFDAVIDLCSIQHNQINNAPIILKEIKRVLKPNGKFFSMVIAKNTYEASLNGKGYVHFYSLKEIKNLFKIFKILSVEKSERTENNMKDEIIHWIVACENSK